MSIDSAPLNTDQIINNISSFTMYFCNIQNSIQNQFHIFFLYNFNNKCNILFNDLRTEVNRFTFTFS